MLLYCILILIVFCLFMIWRLQIMKESCQSSSEPPLLPGGLPLIGHAYKVMGNSVQMLQAVNEINNKCIDMGGAATMYLGTTKVYCVSDPDLIMTVMNTCMQKHKFFDFAKPFLGQGLVTADAPHWKNTRKVLNPAYRTQVLNGFIDIFNSQASKLVDQFAEEVGKEFDQEIILRRNALETIYITAVGKFDDDSETKEMFEQYIPLLSEIMKVINLRLKKFWLHNDFIYSFAPEKKYLDELVKQITAFTNRIIEKKKLEKKLDAQTKVKTNKFKSFMDIILDLAEENDCLTDQQVQWETDTIIAAGHDTVATIMTFVLTVVGSHPVTQDKAYNEIVSVMGNNSNVTKEDLSRLVYIEAIVKEVQRLYEISSYLARKINEDIVLDKYTLKANNDCLILLRGVHRHPMWGPDADQFRPERWFEKETLPDPKYYGAFGLGRRYCIGKTYAMMEMKILLTHILRKYRLTSNVGNMVLEMQSLLVRPHSGHHITLALRK